MYFSELKKLDKQYIANTYNRSELAAVSGFGAECADFSEIRYIDFSSGIGVNSLGFTDKGWVDAVKEQLDKLGHISNLYYTQPQVALAKALCERTGMSRVFFANSGAEANEGAIKTARKYASNKYGGGRYEIITLENSFHGRTVTTLAATGQDAFHKNFGPFTPGFVHANANDADDLISKVSDKTCAIMIECIQGEGGVIPLQKCFIKAIAEVCRERDILLITDEVQTGVGRTGKFLCGQHFGVKPDIVTLAKGLGGGLPIGAVLFSEKTKDTLGFGDHATTFGGNPIVCAGAMRVVEAIDGKFLDEVVEKGAYIEEVLLKMRGVKSVGGKGLMLGIELDEPLSSAETASECLKNGLLILTAKHKLRMLPPLIIGKKEIDAGLKILQRVLCEILDRPEETENERDGHI